LGSKEWDKRFGGIYDDILNSVQQTSDGGYILAGRSISENNGDKTEPSWGDNDYWIVKTDSLGNKEWDKDFGGTLAEGEYVNISQTSDKGYLIGSGSRSGLSGDKSENNLSFQQTWIVKADSLGNKKWDKTMFTTGSDDEGYAIQTKDGCYVIANLTNGGIGGYKTQPNWDTTSFPTADYWIIKFCDTPLVNHIVNL